MWHEVAGRSLLDIFFPHLCPLCGSALAGPCEGFCVGCASRLGLHLIREPLCALCGRPLGAGGMAGQRCGACIKSPPEFTMARSLYAYSGEAREAVHGLKYRWRTMLGPPLGRAMASMVSSMSFSPDLVLPVPLHKKRLRERGFNQSVVLARRVARTLGVAIDVSVLTRTRQTCSQVGLGREERRRNVAGAFALGRPDILRGRSVLLVDDVMTTGATVMECSRVLGRAGAVVAVVTLARALPS